MVKKLNKKLYYATLGKHDVMFISEELNTKKLEELAIKFLVEEITNHCVIKLKKIEKVAEIPYQWRGSCVYNTEKDLYPEDFLYQNDSEYKEFLRLKNIYEKPISDQNPFGEVEELLNRD